MNPFSARSDAARYAKARPDFLHREIVRWLGSLPAFPTRVARALDVGCGAGHSTLPLVELADTVVGIDDSSEMLAQADAHPNVEYVNGRAESLPFDDCSFDLITVGLAFHWFERERFLDEARRVLRPSGLLLIYNQWFTGSLAGVPAFERWFSDVYLARYPSPPRNSDPLALVAWSSRGLNEISNHEFDGWLDMSRAQLVEFLLTQSNVIAAVVSGRESIDEVSRWIHRAVRPFFPATTGRFGFAARATLYGSMR